MYVSPRQAADIAEQKGIKVYTIGIGSNGMAPMPVGYDMLGDYIFKPQSQQFAELPENEDVTMHLAEMVKIKTAKQPFYSE